MDRKFQDKLKYYDHQLIEFWNGVAKVCKDGKWGYINKKGKEIVPVDFDFVSSPISLPLAVKKDGKWGFYDKQGQIIWELMFDSVRRLPLLDVFAVKMDDRWGLIDKNGEMVFEPQFYSIEQIPFTDYIAVEDVEQWLVIDPQTKEIIAEYDSFDDLLLAWNNAEF